MKVLSEVQRVKIVIQHKVQITRGWLHIFVNINDVKYSEVYENLKKEQRQ